jgi:hypothetical protein
MYWAMRWKMSGQEAMKETKMFIKATNINVLDLTTGA